jgi:hypothetical protein
MFLVIDGPNSGANSLFDCGNLDDQDELEDCAIDQLEDCGPQSLEELIECLDDGDCSPSCFGSGDDTVSWTYRSNGEEGTDTIIVCAFDVEFAQLGVQQLDDELMEELEVLEELGCDVVSKEWVEEDDEEKERVPNVGGIFAGDLDAAQRNRERARASAVVAATPRPAAAAPIRPPSTGDAGMRD